MTDELPPLPEPRGYCDKGALDMVGKPYPSGKTYNAQVGSKEDATLESNRWVDADVPIFDTDQMHAYARAAVLAERERCAKVCEAEAESLGSGGKRDAAALCCASAIRAGTTIRKGE